MSEAHVAPPAPPSLSELFRAFLSMALHRVLGGLAAGAAGLIGAMVIKMGQPLLREGAPALAVAALAFVAIGVMRYPLPYVLIVLAPASVALSWWMRR